jgi:hypothetical protein
VQALQFNINEVIPRVQLTTIIEDDILICMVDKVKIALSSHPILAHLRIGDYLPVRVKAVSMEPMQNEVVISGAPFMPEPEISQSWEGQITETDVEHLLTYVSNHQTSDAKKFEMIQELLYPFKTQIKPPQGSKVMSMSQLKPGWWKVSRPQWISDPWSILVTESKEAKDTRSIAPLIRGWANLATQRTKLIEDLMQYKFDKKDQHIWDIYTKSRLASDADEVVLTEKPEMKDLEKPSSKDSRE